MSYGFDLNLPHQRAQVVRAFEDSMSFLDTVVLEGTELKVPPKVSDLQDPRNLLLWASVRPLDELGLWSCAILRIMHTLLYIDNNILMRFLPEIQRQIFERYERHLVQTEDGQWLLRGDYEVPLIGVERKGNKDKTSMLLKLLHKPENVAETIYDYVGIRLVAQDLLDVLLTLRFLLDHKVILAAHTVSSRTRNLMIDRALLAEWGKALPKDFSASDLSQAERHAIAEKLTQRVGRPAVNPYSSSDYSALQFTVNTLVRLPGPGVSALEKIQEIFKERGMNEMADQFHIPELIQAQEEYTFFFAHEVQIMEKRGFEDSRMGPASHLEYKLRQREVVRKRVLRGLLPTEK
jgi:uncharacterized protein (TIGR04562 family)